MANDDGRRANGVGHRPPPADGERPFVVGVGASARGLEAVQAFLANLPPASGVAVVLVFHLDPAAGSVSPEVLTGHTRLPVSEPADGQRVERDRVYTCPADHLLTVQGGCFRLTPINSPGDRRTPIDHTLHSLAVDQKGWAAAVILSGAGSDGALGLKAVSDAGGVTFVQEPATAEFDGMPQSSLASGAVDHVLPPEALAAEVAATAAHTRATAVRTPDPDLVRQAEVALPAVCEVLLKARGHNFRHYKTSTMVRRLIRRVQVLRLRTVGEYVDRLRASEAEAAQLFSDLLINVTAFFRDPEAFAVLTRQVLPELFAREGGDRGVRVWCAGCATGEEAYTLGMLVRESLDALPEPRPAVQIFATDIDEEALAFARQGAYPAGIADDVGADRLTRFFVRKGQHYHVGKELRDLVLFSAHNVITDPPPSRLDLICCRNLLIYLGSHLQKKLIPLFHYALRDGGFLFLGPSESLSGHRELFRPVDARHRISQRLPTAIRPPGLLAGRDGPLNPVRPPNAAPAGDADTYLLMQRIILDEFAPKAVVVNEDGQIVSASGNLEKYLTVSAGAFHNSLPRLVRDGLRVGVRAALAEAHKVRRKVTHDSLSVRTEAGVQRVMVTVQPMPQMGEGTGLFVVVFQDVGLPLAQESPDRPDGCGDAAALVEQLERELTSTRDDLERAVQDLEAANEELKSSNEELLSMNEELLSANEELEASKEEVQAANDALTRVNTDLENLLASTQIATLFLDADGHLRRVTPAAAAVYRVRPDDTGRPLADFTHQAEEMPPLPDYPAVCAAARPIEDEVEMLDGTALLRRVLPYRNCAGEPEGVVVTFTDITARKRAEQEERRRATELAAVLDAVPAVVWTARGPDARTVVGNRAAAELLRLPPQANQSKSAPEGEAPSHFEVFHAGRRLPPDEMPVQRAARGEELVEYEEEVVFADGTRRVLFGNATPLRDEGGRVYGAVAAFLDVTERKQAAEDQSRLAAIVASSDDAIISKTLDGVIRTWNAGAGRVFGYTATEIIGRPITLLVPLDRRDEERDILARIRRGERVDHFETVRVAKDGRRVDISLTVSPLRDETGQIVGASKVARDVGERKRAEAALRAAEDRAAFVRRASGVGFWYCDLPFGVLEWDERVKAHFWLPPDARVTIDTFYAHIHPDDREPTRRAIERSIAEREQYDVHYRTVHPDTGEEKWVRAIGRTFYAADGTPIRFDGLTLDVTELRRAEDGLRASEERYRVLATATEDVVYRVSPDWEVMQPLDGRGLVASNTEPIGGWVDKNLPAAEHGRVREAIAHAVAGRQLFELEHQVIRADGSTGWTSSRAVPILGTAGQIVEWFGTARDVTARKRSEAALAAADRQLRLVIDSLPALIAHVGPDRRYRFVNREYEAWFRRPLERLEGLPLWEVVGQEACAQLAPHVDRALAGERFEVESFAHYPTGGRHVHVSFVPHREGERVDGYYSLITDITDRKRGEQELERVVGQLREQDRRKNEFLATLAHELRNPLAPLRSGLAALKLGGPDTAGETATGVIDRMDRQLSQLVHLVDDLLDMSRVSSGKITLKAERLDLREVVAATLEGCRGVVEAAGHRLTADTPPHPLPVEGDRTRLIQVLTNLLTNSAKYTPAGGQVTLTARRDGEYVSVRVTDTGVGIPTDMLTKVFDLFTQVGHHLDRAQGGLGIGLSLVKRLVEMHDGTVTAESDGTGRGSTFTVRLPASALPVEAPPPPRPEPQPSPPPPVRRTHRVLVVDDNRDGAESLALLIGLTGHEVRTAHDGPAALAEARRFLPRVAFLDIGLPGMNGYDLARAFRADPQLSGVLLVAVTGWGSEEDKQRSREAGFDVHLTKPASVERVLQVLAEAR